MSLFTSLGFAFCLFAIYLLTGYLFLKQQKQRYVKGYQHEKIVAIHTFYHHRPVQNIAFFGCWLFLALSRLCENRGVSITLLFVFISIVMWILSIRSALHIQKYIRH